MKVAARVVGVDLIFVRLWQRKRQTLCSSLAPTTLLDRL
jgi:hypothetical protein